MATVLSVIIAVRVYLAFLDRETRDEQAMIRGLSDPLLKSSHPVRLCHGYSPYSISAQCLGACRIDVLRCVHKHIRDLNTVSQITDFLTVVLDLVLVWFSKLG